MSQTIGSSNNVHCRPKPGRRVTKDTSQSKEDKLLDRALQELSKPTDDEQIFGDFVAASLRNLHYTESKRRLKRQIQVTLIETADYDDELFQARNNTTAGRDNSSVIRSPKNTPDQNYSNLAASSASGTGQSVDILDISTPVTPVSSYFENFHCTSFNT